MGVYGCRKGWTPDRASEVPVEEQIEAERASWDADDENPDGARARAARDAEQAEETAPPDDEEHDDRFQ